MSRAEEPTITTKPPGAMGDESIDVSIVVPTLDTIRTIERCLVSARAQHGVAVEVIVVDNFSTDGTWETALALADVAEQRGPERSGQRNRGIELARGAWILWIDADMELPSGIVAAMLDAARRTDAVGVFAPELSVGDGYWTACRALERSCCWDEWLVQAPRLVRRDYLVATDGFRSSLAGTEDAELRSRMLDDGVPLTWIPDLIVHDEGRITLRGICKKRFYYGRGLSRYRELHPGELHHQAGAAAAAYRRNWRNLASDPFHAIGVVVLRAAEAAAYGLGALAGPSSTTAGA